MTGGLARRENRTGVIAMGWILMVALALALAAPARAEAPRPPGWEAKAADQKSQALVDNLRTLVDDADKRRLASPTFLDDLRKLAQRYDQPWRVELLYDDFGDGNYTANPVWTVAQGRFAVEWGYGLRSVIQTRAPEPKVAQQPQQQKKVRPEDVAASLLGALLRQPQQQQQQSQTAPAQAMPAGKAEIFAPRRLGNAFAIKLELSSRQGAGRIEFGPYQGATRKAGYRLAYLPGARPGLQLVRASEWGTGIIDAYGQALALEDGKRHLIEWTRREDGLMTVAVDGKTLISITDRGFRDPFDGFVLANSGGDFGLHRIQIRGAR